MAKFNVGDVISINGYYSKHNYRKGNYFQKIDTYAVITYVEEFKNGYLISYKNEYFQHTTHVCHNNKTHQVNICRQINHCDYVEFQYKITF